MPIFYDNLGLGELIDDEKVAGGLLVRAVQEGKPVIGYYGCPYINYHYGDAQYIVRTHVKHDDKAIEVFGLDTHADSNSIWKVRLCEPDINHGMEDFLSRRCLVSRETGKGMTVVNIVNADILPSFAPDEVYSLQLIAFPVQIQYFATQEDYAEAMAPKDDLERNILLGEGSVFPIGFMSNHMVTREGKRISKGEEDPENDDYVAVKGTVKRLYHGVLKFEEEEYKAFIRCIIDTEYGELELNHVVDDVDENERPNIKVGAVVCATCVLSADAAINEYADGLVRNEENALRLMRYTWMGGDPERLRYVLRDNCEYFSDSSGKTYTGIDAIIEKIKYVQKDNEHKYITQYASIQSVDDPKNPSDYPIGTRCIVLSSDEPDNYESIGFVTVDDEGYITKIHTCMDSRYHFKLDELPEEDRIEDDVVIPESYKDSMVMRARYHGFFGKNDEADPYEMRDLANEEIASCFETVNTIWDCMPSEIEVPGWNEIENIFGYLFAKGMESGYKGTDETITEAGWAEEYETELEGEALRYIQFAYKYGKQFYTDFDNFHRERNESFMDDLKEAASFVYSLGKQCARTFMNEV